MLGRDAFPDLLLLMIPTEGSAAWSRTRCKSTGGPQARPYITQFLKYSEVEKALAEAHEEGKDPEA